MTAPVQNGNAVARRDNSQAGQAARRNDMRVTLAKYHDSFARVLPKHVTPDRLTTLALVAATKTPALLDCTPESVALALVRVSQWGLEIGTTAHLVPFKGTCTAIADWKGLVQLMIRSGHVRDVKARCVYSAEHFIHEEGMAPRLEHHPIDDPKTRGALVRVYAIAWLKGGVTTFEVMHRGEVDAIRNRARSKDSDAWESHFDEMAKKTVIRRLAKRMPQAATLQEAVAWDDDPERSIRAYASAIGIPMTESRETHEPADAPQLGSGDPQPVDDTAPEVTQPVSEPPADASVVENPDQSSAPQLPLGETTRKPNRNAQTI